MSTDQMQDVFPVAFDYKKGEQPTSTKLSGGVKQTDNAFSRMTRAIGDPWEYSAHSGIGGAYYLSPSRLAQTSLARFSGPSEFVSPRGASFQEAVTSTLSVVLQSYRNTWNVGFPLVSLSADRLPSDTGLTSVQKLVWAVDISALIDLGGHFVTEVASAILVHSHGDFFIDYYTGDITTCREITSPIMLSIDNIHMLGPGVPWGTANVIPHWAQTSTLCTVGTPVTAGGESTYNILLPQVDRAPRTTTSLPSVLGALEHGDSSPASYAQWSTIYTSGHTAQYRLPAALTSNLSNGDSIPEGFMQVWDDLNGRIVPQTTFTYVDEYNVSVTTPEGWLTAGSTVRLLVTGTSLAEAVHHLMDVARDSRHVGLSSGQQQDTLHYTAPISHENITDAYTGNIPSTTVDSYKYRFRKSNYPVNPHPQYLHRAGHMTDDEDGNTSNAMRGSLVLSATYDSVAEEFPGSSDGTNTSTYGIMFGGGTETGANRHPRISWEGGVDIDTWSSGAAERLGFGINEVGAQVEGSISYGALTYTPWFGMPFYIKGTSGFGDEDYNGGVLGFDLESNNELNYIKLLAAERDGTGDYPNQPAHISQTTSSAFLMTPSLTAGSTYERLAAEQVREFRFRGGSYNSMVFNANDSIGSKSDVSTDLDDPIIHTVFSVASATDTFLLAGNYTNNFRIGQDIEAAGFAAAGNNNTFTVTNITYFIGYTTVWVSGSLTTELTTSGTITSQANEFNSYFTSPGMVGVDFLNVYSNMIFFSDTGDGATTSFTDRGKTWFDGGVEGTQPSGIYYIPGVDGTRAPYFQFSLYDEQSGINTTTSPLSFGDNHGFWYTSKNDGTSCTTTTSNVFVGCGMTSTWINYTTEFLTNNNITYPFSPSDGGHIAIVNDDVTAAFALLGMYGNFGVQMYAGGTYHDMYIGAAGTMNILTTGSDALNITGSDATYIKSGGSSEVEINYDSGDGNVYIGNLDATSDTIVRGGNTVLITTSSSAPPTLLADDVTIYAESDLFLDSKNYVYSTTIRDTSPLIFSGAVYMSTTGVLYNQTSSRSTKSNIKKLDDVSWIYDLEVVSFVFKDTDYKSSNIHYGFIADDTEAVNPSLPTYKESGELQGLKYDSIFSALVKAVQDQKLEIEALKAKLED